MLAWKKGSRPRPWVSLKRELCRLTLVSREEVAACAERAYDHLTVPDALSIFKLSNEDELHALADKVCGVGNAEGRRVLRALSH